MVDAVTAHVPATKFTKGVANIAANSTAAGLADASTLATASAATVLVLGTDLSTAHEGELRRSLLLSILQHIISSDALPILKGHF
jgi:hypothetical protein